MTGFVAGTSRRLTGRRAIALLGGGLVVTAAVAVFAVVFGVTTDASGRHVELLGGSAFEPGSAAHTILWFRIARVSASLLVGGALAAAGCALQALLRNPLAEPFTLGVSSGSTLGAVLAIRFGIESSFGDLGVGGAALLGAFATLVLVSRLARIGRQLPPATLVLVGITIAMFCSAASVLIQSTADFVEIARMVRWMMGGLDSMRLAPVHQMVGPIAAGILILLAYSRELNALAAGTEAAASVGVAVGRTQFVVWAVSALLVGAAIALAGPIGFVGLIVPHALRALVGPDHRLLIPLSVLGGGVVLTVCDTVARSVMPWTPLQAGVITPVLGVPFFIAILIRQKRHVGLWSRG
ncbi:MAG: FecCD family ABC transporter permease [Kofleriaceae bacterium]